MLAWLNRYNPAGYTGIVAHTYEWLTSKTDDYVYSNPAFKPSPTKEPLAVYCVHGTADQPQAFARMARRLLRKGLPEDICSINLVAFHSRYAGNGIDFFANQLLEKIKANNHQRVILLGHSRGGLVNGYLAEFLAKENNIQVEAVVSFGTPFYGSYLALAPLSWFSASVQQMQVNNEFNGKLVERILISSIPYYFFVANNDYIVEANSSSISAYVAKKPGSLIILETKHGHLSMLSSHEGVAKVHVILSEASESLLEQDLPCSPSLA